MQKFRSQIILLSFLVFLSIVLPAAVFAQPEIQEGRKELKNRVERFHQIHQEAEERPSTLRAPAPKSSTFELQKDVILQAIDSLTTYEELLQERLVHFPITEENLKASLNEEILADIEQLKDFGFRAQKSVTLEDLRGLANELKMHRKETIEEKIRKQMVLAQIDLFEQRVLETASARAVLISKTLSAATDANALLGDANTKIANTSLLLQTLKKDVRAKEINDKSMSEVRNTLKTATNTMREVYKIFRAISNSSSPR